MIKLEWNLSQALLAISDSGYIIENWELSWCQLCGHWLALEIVAMTTYNATRANKLGVITTLNFQLHCPWLSHSNMTRDLSWNRFPNFIFCPFLNHKTVNCLFINSCSGICQMGMWFKGSGTFVKSDMFPLHNITNRCNVVNYGISNTIVLEIP